MLQLGVGLSLTAGGAALANPGLQSVTTEASATPSTTAATLGPGQTGLRVFTGVTAASEASFDLYVSKNGGSVVKVRMYRWQGRILSGSPGDRFALGTTDGRTLSVAGMTVPTSLAAPSGVTGTANCDQALPAIWSPSAAHVTLPANGSKFQLNSDGTERVVFISEKAPDNTWTPARWVFLPAATNVVVHCNYTQVALANEAGATLSVTAPTSSTVGGTKAVMALTPYVVTGTVRNVTTVAELKTAIAAAVAGDDIVLAAGTYALDVAITYNSFTANIAAGKKGMEGIRMRGATSDRTLYILGGNGTSTNGNWNLTMVGTQQMTAYVYLENLTFDFGAINLQFNAIGGRFRCTNVRWTGGLSSDLVAWDAQANELILDALFCRADTSADDCWNFNGNATYNGISRVRLISCEGVSAGNNAASQCLTSHNGLAVEVYGGTYSDAHTNVMASDANSSPIYAFWPVISKGTRAAGCTLGVTLFGAVWSGLNATTPVAVYLSRLSIDGVTGLRNCLIVEKNVITAINASSRGVFNSLGGGSIKVNIIQGVEAIRLGNAAGAVASTSVLFNTVHDSTTGWNQVDQSNMPVVHKNNAYRVSGTSVNIPTGGMPVITTDYNTLDPTVDADYTAGAHDTTGADAAMSGTTWIPTASGNVDGNGDATVVDYVGDTDPFGFVHIFKADRASRGAREIPAIYSGAMLYPEYF